MLVGDDKGAEAFYGIAHGFGLSCELLGCGCALFGSGGVALGDGLQLLDGVRNLLDPTTLLRAAEADFVDERFDLPGVGGDASSGICDRFDS